MITRRKVLLSGEAALLTGGISMLLRRKQLEVVSTQTTTQPSPGSGTMVLKYFT